MIVGYMITDVYVTAVVMANKPSSSSISHNIIKDHIHPTLHDLTLFSKPLTDFTGIQYTYPVVNITKSKAWGKSHIRSEATSCRTQCALKG